MAINDELNLLTLAQALTSDDAHKERSSQLAAQMRELVEREASVKQQQAELNASVDRIQAETREHAATKAEAEAKLVEVQQKTDGLTSAMASHQDDKMRFAEMERTIRAELDARTAAVTAREAEAEQKHAALDARAADLDAREASLAGAEEAHQRRRDAAAAFLEVA